jgi:hypothetical protein
MLKRRSCSSEKGSMHTVTREGGAGASPVTSLVRTSVRDVRVLTKTSRSARSGERPVPLGEAGGSPWAAVRSPASLFVSSGASSTGPSLGPADGEDVVLSWAQREVRGGHLGPQGGSRYRVHPLI